METRKRVSRSCSSLSPRRAVANRLRFTVELVYVARRNLETNQPEQKRNRECWLLFAMDMSWQMARWWDYFKRLESAPMEY